MKESWELAEDFWRIEMNANELADEWQNKVDMWEGKHYENWCEEVSTMLRQQQAEIEAIDDIAIEMSKVIKKQQAEIEVLKVVLEQEGIGVGRDLLNGGIALFRKASEK